MDAFLSELSIAAVPMLQGMAMTILISLLSIVIGSALGLMLGIGLTYGAAWVRWPIRAYVDAVRGTPVLVLIFASFYLLAIAGLNLSAVDSGVLALSIFSAAHMAEIIRGALQSIPPTQIEAGRSIGLTFAQILVYVLLPQGLRAIVPVWTNMAVELVKASTLLSIIGVGELLLKTQEAVGRNFMTLEFYALCGLLFFVINFSIERLGAYAARRLPA